MITTTSLAGEISVCGFVSDADLPQLAGTFRTIVNARPDAEEPGQPSSAEIEQTARRLGLQYVHIPVVPGQITEQQVAAFARALTDKPHPVLAYCKSGNRAASLWALARVGKLGVERVIAAAAQAGFDLESLRPKLELQASG